MGKLFDHFYQPAKELYQIFSKIITSINCTRWHKIMTINRAIRNLCRKKNIDHQVSWKKIFRWATCTHEFCAFPSEFIIRADQIIKEVVVILEKNNLCGRKWRCVEPAKFSIIILKR